MKKLLVTLLLITSSSLSLGYYFFLRPLPQRQGQLELPGLQNSVDIKYDEHGIPHIRAENQKDAYRSLGYIVGQHRLFQLDMQRRMATGSLSEVIGEKALALDEMNRSLGFRYYGQKMAEQRRWSIETQELIASYLEGLNHFVTQGPLPIEFLLLGYRPKTFSESDILAFIAYMGFSFQEAIKQEPLQVVLKTRLSQAKYAELFDIWEFDAPAIDQSIARELSQHVYNSVPWRAKAKTLEALRLQESWGFSFAGSNSWVVSAERSSTGAPLLANDPHIGHSNPGVWFEASIETPDFALHGHYLSLIPFAVLGKTPVHAWSLTMSEIDDMDFFHIEKRGSDYYAGERKIPVESVTEKIKVKKAEDKTLSLTITEFGILLDDWFDFAGPQDHLAAFWSFYHPDNQILEGLKKMGQAKSLEDFRSAVSLPTAPGLNISYADTDKNIAWFALGRTLERPPGHNGIDIRFSKDEDQAPSLIPFSENPHLINPPSGYIVTANHIVSHEKRQSFPGYFQPSDRARRIIDLLSRKERFSPEDMITMLHDTGDDLFPQVKDLFLASIQAHEEVFGSAIITAIQQSNELRADPSSQLFPIYRMWLRQVSRLAMLDELGDVYFNDLFKTPRRYNLLKNILTNKESPWWDKENTTDIIETREDILNEAALASFYFLSEKLGDDVQYWSWGRLHTLELKHPLGKLPPLDKIFNLGPFPAPGAYMIVNANSAREKWDDFSVVSGPSTRRLIDMAERNFSYSILPSGNSGHRFDVFHSNQISDFFEGKLQVRPQSFQQVKAVSNRIQLLPAK